MNWLHRLAEATKAARMTWSTYGTGAGNWTAISGSIFRNVWSSWGYPASEYDYSKTAGSLHLNSAVASCIFWMQRTFPEPTLQVLRQAGQDEEAQRSHALVRLLKRPNPYYSADRLWQSTLWDWVLSGNAYWRKVRNVNGQPLQLWYLPASTVTPIRARSTDYVSYYLRRVDSSEERIPVEDMVHFRFGKDPDNDMLGWGPLAAGLREIATDNEAGEYSRSILANMGVAGAVFSPKAGVIDEIDAEKAAKFKRLYQEATTGSNRGTPILLSLPVDMESPAATPESLKIDTLRNVPEDRICALLGIPPMVVGLSSGALHKTYANYAEARESAIENNIIPTQKLFAADLDIQLLPDLGNPETERVAWDYSKVRVLQEDENKKWDRSLKALELGAISVNEWREMVNIPSVAGPEADTVGKAEPPPEPVLPESTGDRIAQRGTKSAGLSPVRQAWAEKARERRQAAEAATVETNEPGAS